MKNITLRGALLGATLAAAAAGASALRHPSPGDATPSPTGDAS